MLLEESGLAVRHGAWWGLHPELAWLYTCALADKLAVQNKLVPTTDRDYAYTRSLGWTDHSFVAALLGQTPRTAAASEGSWAAKVGELAIRLVVPADLSSVSIDKIVKIRQRHGDEFDAFIDEVGTAATDLASQLGEIKDPGVLEAYLNQESPKQIPATRERASESGTWCRR